jgi:hypothetical protein
MEGESMKRFYLIVALVVGGCDSPMDMPMVDMKPDLRSPGDMAMVAGLIGDPCTDNTGCKEGTTPTCWKARLLNMSGYLPTHGGLCTSSCTSNTDCGANGSCEDFGGTLGKWCFKKCMAATDCRSTGYACFLFNPDPVCFPNDNLNCDATAGDGSCADFNMKAGGCVRAAMGTGNNGSCEALCQLGTGTCPPTNDGDKQNCMVDDETRTLSGMTTGDKFKGPICFTQAKTPPPVAANAECLYTPMGSTMASHYFDVCTDGYECYLKGMGTGGGFDQNGDDKCRQLCYLTGAMSALPDGGMALPDGGVVAPVNTCAVGTCHDVWGSPFKVGLCY